jgi:hypothetical protein
MKRPACAAGVLALLVASGLAGADDEETPTIKEVMQKRHKGADSPLAKLELALEAEE